MMAGGLSVFVLAKNAQIDLGECLESSRSIADEIVVVVDAGSTDATADVARAATPKVFVRPFDGFSAMKNFALSQCTRRWALNLDTDERPTGELVSRIAEVKKTSEGPVEGYAVNRLPFFLGAPIRHGGWYPDWVVRLVRRDRASYPARPVHERLEVSGPTARLNGHLMHYTARNWDQFLDKQRRFAALSPVGGSRWARITHPAAAFVRSAIFQFGFLDGWRGLAVAYAQGYYAYYKYRK